MFLTPNLLQFGNLVSNPSREQFKTTYIYNATYVGTYDYEVYYNGDSGMGDFCFTDPIDITLAEGDVDYFTVENGELSRPDFQWEDYFNWFYYYSISDIQQITWDGGVSYFFRISESYSYYFPDDYFGYGLDTMDIAVGGDSLPDFDVLPDEAQATAFYDFYNGGTVENAQNLYPEDMTLGMAELPGVVVSEDGTFYGSGATEITAAGKGKVLFVEAATVVQIPWTAA